jgi:hypothetical protein
VNQRLNRGALLARAAVARRVKFVTLPPSEQAEVAAPSFGLIADPAGGSVRRTLDEAAIPHAVTISAFRRLGRPRGPLSPKHGLAERPAAPSSNVVTASLLSNGAAELLEHRNGALPAGMDIAVVPDVASLSAVAARLPRFARARRRDVTPDGRAAPIGNAVDRDVIVGDNAANIGTVVMARPADGPLIAAVMATASAPAPATWAAVALAVDPAAGVRRSVNSRMIGVDEQAPVPPRLRAAPVFPDPMYERLRAMSSEYLVPGLGLVAENTVGALEVNPEFVESFLLGLNHELSREFRWREYPAQLWRTWFHQFWDTGSGGAPDLSADIHTWKAKSALGAHVAGGNRLVLLVKGDLIRRYPDVNVYAIRATMDGGELVAPPGSEILLPAFVGQLQRGVHFYGFDLELEDARGDGPSDGWFFALEEQPRGPRFGFDAAPAGRRQRDRQAGATPVSWSDMTWAYLRDSADETIPMRVDLAAPDALQGLTLGSGASADTWAENAAAMARITLRTATRVLIHGSSLLPGPDPLPGGRRR